MPLRTEEEIREAFGFLSAIINFNDAQPEEARMNVELRDKLNVTMDALGWALGMPEAKALADNMAHLRRVLSESGFKIIQKDKLTEILPNDTDPSAN